MISFRSHVETDDTTCNIPFAVGQHNPCMADQQRLLPETDEYIGPDGFTWTLPE